MAFVKRNILRGMDVVSSIVFSSHLSVYGHIMAYSVIVVMIELRIDAFKVWRLMLSDEVSQFRFSESGKLLCIRPAFQIFFHVCLADGCWCWYLLFHSFSLTSQ